MNDSGTFSLAWYEPGVFDVEIEPCDADGILVVRVRGELDQVIIPALRGVLQRAMCDAPHLVVDLSGLTFCGLSGVAELKGAISDAASRGVTLALSGMSAHLRRVWAVTEIHTYDPAAASSESQTNRHRTDSCIAAPRQPGTTPTVPGRGRPLRHR